MNSKSGGSEAAPRHYAQAAATDSVKDLGQDRAHTARVHNYLLGGKNNYRVDRAAGDAVRAAFASISRTVLAGQTYAQRVARHLARQGARQFIELGVGLPPQPYLHDTVQATATADTSTLYIDNDPITEAYADALLTDLRTGRSHAMEADVRDPEGLLAAVREHGGIDLDRPVAVFAHALLDFLLDEEDPHGVVAGLLSGLPAGSCFSLTHSAADLAPEAWTAAADAYRRHGISFHPRTGEEVGRFLTGLDAVGPGLTTAFRWHSGSVESDRARSLVTERQAPLYAGAGRLP
ncbi:SAM-dependent methyltransferase [Streptomyces griseus]|uniref:SAM-dependent methyltransferase n=1 Tax=Streptomyces griseus TaxID=1911 RepID=UPI0036CDAB45